MKNDSEAKIRMVTRTELLNHFIASRGFQSYLEIGVGQPALNYNQIQCAQKIGIDPRPLAEALGIQRRTSDDFFTRNSARFDLIFVDGDHRMEAAWRDIAFALGALNPGGIVVIHDALPPEETFTRLQDQYFNMGAWTGGVWEAVLRHFSLSPHHCFIVDTDWGVAVIDTSARNNEAGRLTLPDFDLIYDLHFPLLSKFRIQPEDIALSRAGESYPCVKRCYEIYCCYHKRIFPWVYGAQYGNPIFVKVGDSASTASPPRTLDLRKYDTFVEMGRHYAEIELLLNLFWADRAGFYDLPEYVGFIHYDMSVCRAGGQDPTTIFDYLDLFDFRPNRIVSFQPYDGSFILTQPDCKSLMKVAMSLYSKATHTVLTDSELNNSRLALADAFVVHRDVFKSLCVVLEAIWASGDLDEFDIEQRAAGGILERVAALHFHASHLELSEFIVDHSYMTGVQYKQN